MNRRGFNVLEPKPIEPIQSIDELNVLAPEAANSAAVVDAPTVNPPADGKAADAEPSAPTSRKHSMKLILAAAGVGTIAAGVFGFHWWQYASSHEET